MNTLGAALHGLFCASISLMLWYGILTVYHSADANYYLEELKNFLSHTLRSLPIIRL